MIMHGEGWASLGSHDVRPDEPLGWGFEAGLTALSDEAFGEVSHFGFVVPNLVL